MVIKQRLLSNRLLIECVITLNIIGLTVVLDQLKKPGFGIINITARHCWIDLMALISLLNKWLETSKRNLGCHLISCDHYLGMFQTFQNQVPFITHWSKPFWPKNMAPDFESDFEAYPTQIVRGPYKRFISCWWNCSMMFHGKPLDANMLEPCDEHPISLNALVHTVKPTCCKYKGMILPSKKPIRESLCIFVQDKFRFDVRKDLEACRQLVSDVLEILQQPQRLKPMVRFRTF